MLQIFLNFENNANELDRKVVGRLRQQVVTDKELYDRNDLV